MNSKDIKIIIGAILFIIAIVAFGIISDNKPSTISGNLLEGVQSLEKLSELSSCPLPVGQEQNLDEFAKCLTDKDFVMYGAVWCSHCKEQKNMFGSSFQYINYVECPDNINLCKEKGVDGVPAWEIQDVTATSTPTSSSTPLTQ